LVRKEIFGIEADPRSPERGQYRFLQGLVRTVAYDTVARRDRKVRHLAAADYYAGVPDADDLVAVVATHLLAAREAAPNDADAGDLAARAVTLLERAGSRAMGLGATAEAMRYFQSALDLATEPEAKARLSDAAARAAFRGGELRDAAELAARSRALWTELGRPVPAASVATVEAEAYVVAGDPERGLAVVTEHLPAVDGVPGGEAATLALLTIQATALSRLNRKDESITRYPRCLQLAERLGAWGALVRNLNGYGSLLVTTGQPTHGLALITAALDVARREQVVGADILPLNNLAAMQLYRDLPAARRAAEEGLAACRRLGDRTNAWWLAANLAFALWLDGTWDEIGSLVEEVGAAGPAATLPSKTILAVHAQVQAARGEHVEEPAVQEMIDSSDASARPFGLLERAIAAFSAGRAGDAAGLAVEATHSYHDYGGIEDDYPLFWVPAVEFALAAGRLTEARTLLDQVASMSAHVTPRYLQIQLPRLRALLACAEHDDASAEPDLRTAVDDLRSYGSPFYEARARLELAELLMRTGRPDQARPYADAAAAAFTRLGATPWVERSSAVTSLASV
jgi:tetratricopeptide (TPR) repeat protein